MPGDLIRILVVEDHAAVRAAILRDLTEQPDLCVVGEAEDAHAAYRLCRDLSPDVILMDVSMPGIGGVEATRQIHNVCPDVKVIGLSADTNDAVARRMRDAGAIEYVEKGEGPEVLVGVIHSVCGRVPTA